MKNVSKIISEDLKRVKEAHLEYEDGSKSNLYSKSFSIPGMLGNIHVKKVEIDKCEVGHPLEIRFYVQDVGEMKFSNSSKVTKIKTSMVRRK